MSRLLGSVRRPWMVALFAILAVGLSVLFVNTAQAAAPVTSAYPSINSFSGYGPTNGRTATITAGTWTADETPTLSYQWYRCYATGTETTTLPSNCYVINNRANTDYGITQADVGWYLRVAETATTSGGSVTAYSATTSRILASRTLASGHINYCAIKDGAVSCWGTNAQGQLGDNTTGTRTTPTAVLKSDLTPLTGAVAVASSSTHSCAVLSDGSLWCWGANGSGQLGNGTTTASKTAVKVQASSGVDLANIVDVSVAGDMTSGNPTAGTTCAINTSGALSCWGYNSAGQLGIGTSTSVSYPTAISSMSSGVNQVSIGDYYTCAIKDGAAYCWGYNNQGQLGLGNNTSYSTPQAISSLASNTSAIVAGPQTTCAIKNGAAYCWGFNSTGQHGTGTTASTTVPVSPIATLDSNPVSLGVGVIDIALGKNPSNTPYNTTCFLKESGAVICTGYNQFRQLTDGTTTQSSTPVRSIFYTSNVSEIEMGQYSICAIMNGNIRCMGQQNIAGDGTATASSSPSTVTGMSGLAPESYTPNIASSTISQPKYVGTGQTLNSFTPNEVSGYPSPAASFQWFACSDAVGGASSITPSACYPIAGATATNYTITSSEFGKYIRLQTTVTDGSNVESFVSSPTIASGTPPTATGTVSYSGSQSAGPIPGLVLSSSPVVSFSGAPTPTGVYAWYRCTTEVTSTVYSTIDGTVPNGCMVINGATESTYKVSASDVGFYISAAQVATTSAGQSVVFGQSTDLVRAGQKVSMSINHTCVIKSGLVYCWGSNNNGQLGNGGTTSTTKPSLTPVKFSDGSLLKDVISISVATAHSCALTNSGSVFCWGLNNKGQLGDGTTTQQLNPVQVLASAGTPFTDVTVMAAGGDNTCVIKSTQLYCFGGNALGQIGKGVVEVSANYTYPTLNTALSTGVQQVTISAEKAVCAIKLAQAYCWGTIGNGLLGYSAGSTVATPTLLSTLPANVSNITLGSAAGCAVASSKLYCWGTGTYGSNGSGLATYTPTLVSGAPQTAVQVSTSLGGNGAFTCFYTITEDVYCMGDNAYYAYPYNTSSTGNTTVRKTGNIAGISEIATGDRSSCFVAAQALKCVGYNLSGQVGVGNSVPSYYPATPAGMDKYIGSSDLAPQLKISTTGFATPSGTLVGNTEDLAGEQTFGFPYPTFQSAWNTCTELGPARNSLPADCLASTSATGNSLALSASDAGSKFRFAVTASNSLGSTTKVTASIGPVQDAPTTYSTEPAIAAMTTPVPLVGYTVSATPSLIAADGSVNHDYQWYRCSAADSNTATNTPAGCTLVAGGTSRTYQVRPEDTGSYLRFSDTARASAGDLTMFSPTTSDYVLDGQTISSNGSTTCAVRQGLVQCWGSQTVIGDGTGVFKTSPKTYVSISAGVKLTDVVSVSVGTDAACAIKTSGALYCWGSNTSGSVGDGTTVAKLWATPVSATSGGIVFSSGVMQVSVGFQSTCAVKFGGGVYCWGRNAQNVLGNSALTLGSTYSTPQETDRAAALSLANTGATRVTVGNQNACLIQGGFLYCTGYGGYGQLVNGTNGNNTTFDKFKATNNYWATGGFTDVSTSYNSICFVQNGGVRCVGSSSQYENGTTITASSSGSLVFNEELWTGVVSIAGYKEVTSGQVGFCASKLDANYCWGQNANAQSWGLTSTVLTTPTKLPVFVNHLAPGLKNTCGLLDGTIYCVGLNAQGNLGDGTLLASRATVSTGITSGVGTVYADPSAVTQQIGGQLISGTTLSASPQMPFAGYPRPTMSYQWYRCLNAGESANVQPNDCFAIAGATSETYNTVSADLGKRFRLGATGVLGSFTQTNFSAATNPIGVAPTSPNTAIRLIGPVIGTPVGATFQQSKPVYEGTAPITVTYGWLRCITSNNAVATTLPSGCTVIPNATSASYTTTNEDISYYLRGMQTATNASGSTTLYTATGANTYENDKIAVADGTTCVIKEGNVWCVGAGTRGQLGNLASVDSNVPVQVKRSNGVPLSSIRHLTGAGTHFCAVGWSSQVAYCWGSNTNGELGFGNQTDLNYANQVTNVIFINYAGSFASGPNSSCVINNSGLQCWGSKANGLIGNNTSTGVQLTPATISVAGASNDFGRVAVGANSACVTKTTALYCWGLNNYGQLGDGTTTTRLVPTAVPLLASGVSDIAVGSGSTCAVVSGEAKCWGSITSSGTPATIANATDGTSFASGVVDVSMSSNPNTQTQDSVCVTKSTGAVYCFGYNDEGQLFTGDTVSTTTPKPALVATSGVTNVAVGSSHSCFWKDNSVHCSGSNGQGQLLDSTTTSSSTPVNVAEFSGINPTVVSNASPSTNPGIFGLAAKVGKAIQSDPGVYSANPLPTFSYQWYTCTTTGTATTTATIPTGCAVSTGSTASTETYVPVAADKDKYLRLYLAVNTAGTVNSYYTATSAKVAAGDPVITFNALPAPLIVGGDAVQLTPVSSSGNTSFTYSSSTPSLCSVTSSGMISGLSAGICDIVVSQAAAGAYNAVSAIFSAKTGPGEQAISFTQPADTPISATPFTPAVSASSGLEITLSSSTASVCTVSSGSVNLLSLGTCTLSANQPGNSAYYAAETITRSFEVLKGSQTLTFIGGSLALSDGTLTLDATSSAGLTPSYETSSSACSITGTNLNILSVGSCVVTASQVGDENYNPAEAVTVTYRILSAPTPDSVPAISGTPTFAIAFGSTPGVWVGAGTVTVTKQWYSCTSDGIAISATGNLSSNKPSDCTAITGATSDSITPTASEVGSKLRLAEQATNVTDGTTNYYSAFTATSATVVKQSQAITFAALSNATFGDSEITLDATSDRGLAITYSSSDSAVCSISGSTLNIVGAGSCDVTASQSGNGGTLAATSVVRTLNIAKANQTITMPNFSAGVYGGAAKASGAASTSGLTVTLSSADSSICSVSGLNVIQVSPGTCSITASQVGNANFNAATDVTKSFTIAKASQTISFTGSVKQKPAGNFDLAAITTSGLAISYASTTLSVCTVSGSTVTPVTLGTCTLTASQAGDANYSAASPVNANFTIESMPVQASVEVIGAAANYRFGTAVTVTAGTWSGTATVSISRAWYRCDTAASISVGTGSAASLAPADCVLISGASSTTYTPVAADVTKFLAVAETASNTTSTGSNLRTTFVSTATTIEKQTQAITFGTLSAKTFGDAAFALSATSDRSLTISYASSNTAVCTVSGSTVTIVGAGTCDITASQVGNSTTLAATEVVRTLTVAKASQTVSLNNLVAIDFRGTPTALVYSATSGLAVSVASNDTAICTVSGTTVSVVAVGTCSITASQAGNANYNAATSVTKTFVISKAQDTLSFTGATKQFRAGNFTISATTLSGVSVSFASTTPLICSVAGTTVTPVTHGACVITATAAANSNYTAPANVNATFTIERSVEQSAVHSMTAFSTYWYDQQINYTAGTWVGSGTVSVSHTWYACTTRPTSNVVSGTIVPAGCVALIETSANAYKPAAGDIGKYIVLAETASNVTSTGTNTSTSWISATGVVTKWGQILSFATLADKTYGDLPFTLTGVSDQGKVITYTSSNTAVCTVSGAVVSIVSAGTCDITASQDGTATVAAATPITRTLTVNKAAQTITFATLANLTYSANPVTAVVSTSSSLAASVVSNDTSVCTISALTISLVKAGTCSISASQAGNANYTAATSVTRTFAVSKAAQVVTFTIAEFMSLGEQNGLALNGTSDAGLSITYSVNDDTVCDIQNERLVAVAPGACSITATQNGDDRYEADSVTRNVTVANYAVVESMVPNGSNFTNSASTGFTITFDSAISGFTASDLSTVPAGVCTIGEPAAVNNDAAVYSVALTDCDAGSVVLKVAANSISNGAPGPALDYIGLEPVTVDFAFLQSVTVVPQFATPTNRTSLAYNVTFAEDVTGFTASDLTMTGSGSANCVADVTGSGSAYVVTLTGCTDGALTLSVGSTSVADLAGNAGPTNVASSSVSTIDLIAPVSPVATGLPEQYSRSTDINVEFAVVAGNTYHCSLNGVEIAGCDGTLTIPAASMVSGDYTLEIWATDAAGNDSARDSHTWTIGAYERPATPEISAQGFDRTAFNHLTINWSLPVARSAELPITGLELEYSTNGTTWTAVPELAADATSYDLTMQSGKVYSFRLRALSGPFAVNASDLSDVETYTATYQPAITVQSTNAALQKPAAGTTITLTGVDFRDFANLTASSTTGTVVTVTDAAGKPYVAKLVTVTNTSIRFTVPSTSKVGMATVKVTVGSGNFARTSATRNINIVAKKVNQVLTFTPLTSTRVAADDIQMVASMNSLIVPTFAIEPGSIGICTVSTTGILHPIKGGTCAFKVTAPAGDAYNSFTSNVYSIPVIRLNVAMDFELPQDLRDDFNENQELPIGPATYQLTAISDASIPGVSVKVTATPETTCFVDADLILHIVGTGPCSITALAENDFYRTEVPVNRVFNIARNSQTLTYVAPGTTLGLISAVQATDSPSGFQLSAFLSSGLTPLYESINAEICSVDATGIVLWNSDLVKTPNDVCQIKIGHPGDANFNPVETQTYSFPGVHIPPLAPVGGWIREPDGALAVGRTGGLAASGADGVAVVVVTGSKVTIRPFSRGLYIGPITATVTIPYYIRVKNVMTLKSQKCVIKFGIRKKYKAGHPDAFKVKSFPNTKACSANKDAVAYFKAGNQLLPTIVVTRDRRWPTTYIARTGGNGKGKKIYPAVKTWHLTIG